MISSVKTGASEVILESEAPKTSIQEMTSSVSVLRKAIIAQRREIDAIVSNYLKNESFYQEGANKKNINLDFVKISELCNQWREIKQDFQKIGSERNKISNLSKDEAIKKGPILKQKYKELDEQLMKRADELRDLLMQIPNPAKNDVKVGKDETENEVVKKYKEPTKFGFTPKDHLELGEALDIVDVKRAAKVSGTRFAYLKNEGVLLEFALIQLALEILIKEGFTPVIPPVLINQEITEGLGYWQGGGNEDYYLVGEPAESKNFYLVGTAEHAIVPMHKDELFNKKDLPKRYAGFSTCFRREAGSYGKDTRGILRVHQFDKVEMVSFTTEENDDKEHEYLLSLEEKLFQLLDIPYQVVKMCTGDLGFPAARKYDIEAWIPTQNKYREVTSVSTVTDFQSRRLNIRYQENNERKYAYVLNGTAFAMPRTIIAILENYQQEDGSVAIPKALQKFVGKSVVNPKK